MTINGIAQAKKEAKKACNQIAAYEIDQQINERCFEIAERAEENRDKPCLANYVRGSAFQLSWDVACSFAEIYSNKMLDDVCDLLREMDFFKSDEGISEACMEEQFRRAVFRYRIIKQV